MTDSPLIFALCGLRLQVEDHTVDAAVAALAAHGLDAGRVRECFRSQGLWPHALPEDLRGVMGAAQLGAQLEELRGRVGVDAPTQLAAERTLTRDERRLLDEVPPHFGKL